MIRLMRRLFWVAAAGGLALGGWSFFKLRGNKDELPQGNWTPVPKASNTTGGAAGTASDTTTTTSAAGGATQSASSSTTRQSFAGAATTKDSANSDRGATSSGAAATASRSSQARSSEPPADAKWVAPDENGSCPVDFAIKANDGSKIYHLPTGRSYRRTKAERCYANAEDAAADGYRAAKA